MRSIHFIALVCVLYLHSQCTHYQIYSFTTDQVPSIEKKGFIESRLSDSLLIHYRWFMGDNKGVVDIENIGNQLAYLDLSKSAVIVNGIKQSLFADLSETYAPYKLNRQIRKLSPQLFAKNKYPEVYETVTTVAQNQTVLLPKSKSRYFMPQLPLGYSYYETFNVLRLKEFEKKEIFFIRKKNFDKSNTPITVRIFLVYKVGEAGKEQIVDKTFWLHEIIYNDDIKTMKVMSNDRHADSLDKRSFNKLLSRKKKNKPAY